MVWSLGSVGVRVYFKIGDQSDRAKRFRDALVKLGPAFVKFGPGIIDATRRVATNILRRVIGIARFDGTVGFGKRAGVFEDAFRVRTGSGVRDVRSDADSGSQFGAGVSDDVSREREISRGKGATTGSVRERCFG